MTINWLYRPPRVEAKPKVRRPSEAPTVESVATNGSTNGKVDYTSNRYSTSSNSQRGIPEELSFENIMDNKRSPPCTLRDFMMYLHFFEHTVENMQFLLWHEDYSRRFEALPASEKALSPPWEPSAEAEQQYESVRMSKVARNSTAIRLFGGDAKAKESLDMGDRPTLTAGDKIASDSDFGGSQKEGGKDYKETASQAFTLADLKWQPFTIQPMRDDVSRAIATYFTESSPRELNMTSRDRSAVLHALEHTTHPSAFHVARMIAENSLRDQSHPAFIRWTLRNGNPERIAFAHVCAGLLIPLAFIIAAVLTLSTCGRWWRVMGVLSLWPGVALAIAARRGICVILHAMGHRCQFRPWEVSGCSVSYGSWDEKATESRKESVAKSACADLEKGQNGSSAPWEDEFSLQSSDGSLIGRDDYKVQLKKINIVRRIFCKDRYIEEPALRDIQTAIVLQSFLGATISSILFCCLFVPLPHGNYF